MMTYEILFRDSLTSTVCDISSLVDTVEFTTQMTDQPGACKFTVNSDPTNQLIVANGSIVTFKVNGIGVFYGYVFSIETSADKKNKVTCYDQIRYLKSEEIYVTADMTASQIFEMVCRDTMPNSQHKVIVPSTHPAPAKVHSGSTLYDIIKYGIEETNAHEVGKQYFIRDNYGVLEFTEISALKTNYVIGDGDMLTGYTYGLSIDKDTYNYVKMYREDKEVGRFKSWIAYDASNEALWGKLQKTITADNNLNDAEIVDSLAKYHGLYNRETQTLKIDALGIPELTAGVGFTLRINDLGMAVDVWITSASHTYKQGIHTMSLTVVI